MAQIQGQVGQQTVADGSNPNIRQTKDASVATQDSHGRYTEPVYRGNIFSLDSDSVTLAAANATKGNAGTIKFLTGFYNPVSSGKNAIILRAIVATVSGTPAGPYFLNVQQIPGGISSAATGTIRNALLGAGSGSVMTAQVNTAVTRSDAATTAFTQLATLSGPAAIAAGAGTYGLPEELAGLYIVPPGWAFGIAATGAGTTHIVQSTLTWEEANI